ncbi:MAG: hypothetical protein QM504_11650 [Pseudomonadota bacterium]
MGLNKILNQLKDLFQEDSHKKKQVESVRALLKKLKNKEQKLENHMAKEKNEKKRKELKLNLQVIRAQQKKGKKLLKEQK